MTAAATPSEAKIDAMDAMPPDDDKSDESDAFHSAASEFN